MNVKAKEVALFSALSQKVRDNEVLFIDEIKVDAPKTKEIIKTLGFSGEIYFYRWFKQNFNMTLNEYKEKIKNED